MKNATDYYNLLNDTLKYSYSHIIFIYKKIDKAITEGKWVNIRSGYIMDAENTKSDCYYRKRDTYPICYSMPELGLASKEVLNKIFDFYQHCLTVYKDTKDKEKIKKLVEDEVEKAKMSYVYLNKQNNGKNDFDSVEVQSSLIVFQEQGNSPNQFSYNDKNESSSKDSFIDDEVIKEENEEEEENEESELSNVKEDDISSKDEKKLGNTNKKRKLRKVNEYKKEYEDLMDESYRDEPENISEEDGENKNILCQKRERGVINDDESENEEQIGELILKDLKEEKEEKKTNGNVIQNDEKDQEYFKEAKQNITMKQKTLDGFLGIEKK